MKGKVFDLFKNNNKVKYIIIFVFLILVLIISIVLFKSKDNNSNFEEYKYYLNLVGDKTIEISVGENYQDEGYFAYDNKGNNLYDEVEVIGTYDSKKIGEYKITYKLKDIVLYRVIRVVSKNDDKDKKDDLKIGLNGESVVYILKNKTYKEEYAYAYDSDSNLTNQIEITGHVDTSKVGSYSITYKVTNKKGLTKSVTREVIVYDVLYSVNKNCISSKCDIKFTFKNEYFKYIILPDGSKKISKDISYSITNNGTYNFLIYDIYGNQLVEKVEISSIDNEKPKATCNLYLYDESSKIVVNAFDNIGIKGYMYYYGSKVSNLVKDNTFTYLDNINEANVSVYDNNNNYVNVKCNVIDNSTKYERSYRKYESKYDYWVYVPNTLSKRNKAPLVVYLHGSGECGSGVNNNSLPYYIKKEQDYEFVMVAPQLPSDDCGSGFYAKRVMEIIEMVMDKYPIDSRRVIITGFSLGGNGTYRMLKDYPNFFAAGIPLAARTGYEENLTKTPIWAFHGSDDPYVSYREEKQTMEKVISINPNSKYTLLEGEGHIIYDLVYKNQEVINWIMNSYRK